MLFCNILLSFDWNSFQEDQKNIVLCCPRPILHFDKNWKRIDKQVTGTPPGAFSVFFKLKINAHQFCHAFQNHVFSVTFLFLCSPSPTGSYLTWRGQFFEPVRIQASKKCPDPISDEKRLFKTHFVG